MAELVYAHDLKSCLARDVGSIPTPGTQLNKCALSSAVAGSTSYLMKLYVKIK